MPLEEIREILDDDDLELIQKRLAAHRESLAEHERMLAYLESLMRRMKGIMRYEVEVAEAEPQYVGPRGCIRTSPELEPTSRWGSEP